MDSNDNHSSDSACGQQDILSAALNECGLGEFFADPIVQDDLTRSLPSSPNNPFISDDSLINNNDNNSIQQQEKEMTLTNETNQQNSNNVQHISVQQISRPKITILKNSSATTTQIPSNITTNKNGSGLKIKRYVIKFQNPSGKQINQTMNTFRIQNGQITNSSPAIVKTSDQIFTIHPKKVTISNSDNDTNSPKVNSSNVILNDISNHKLVKILNPQLMTSSPSSSTSSTTSFPVISELVAVNGDRMLISKPQTSNTSQQSHQISIPNSSLKLTTIDSPSELHLNLSRPNEKILDSVKQRNDEIERNILESEEMKRLLEETEDELANLETFAEYKPAKLKIGFKHPDSVVETSSLASIPPPEIYYQLRIPEEVIDENRLSALQLESIIYASQQHENFLTDGTRAGFLIGDGAGVGKGRTIAGIIYENYLHGRKRSLWFSVSTDLKYDAERDFYDIGANRIEVHLLNKFKYGHKIHSIENDNVKRGVIFATYNSLIGESTSITGKFSTRFQQITQWCGEDFDGVIVFDECHKAKNLFPSGSTRATKTGQAVLDLQKRLPKARVVYASATGATEPKNMGYMTRLGIWGPGTPFEDFNSFVSMVEKRGVGAMELVAIDLKMRGMYMARQLSFKGVQFRIEHVPLSREFIRIYNCCCRLWVSAKTKFEKALELMDADPQVSKAIWTQFWASHQRFFKYLCIASKVKFAVTFIKEALRCDKSVVIGLQSTGEARTLEQLEENGGELTDFVSTAKSVFQSLVERHFPAPNRKKLAKLLGQDTSFFDQLGIKLERNARNEIVASFDEEFDSKPKRPSGQTFFDSDIESEEDFIEVDDPCVDEDDQSSKSSKNSDSEDDLDSDDLDEIDDIMDQKLGLKPGGKPSASLKFMDILLGPSTLSSSKNNSKRKRKVLKKHRLKKAKIQNTKKPVKKSLKNKYEKYYTDFDNVGDDVGGYCEMLKTELIEQLESFGERLPPNTLDEVIDELGGPEMVAEMTGRKGRIVSTQDGQVQYETRTENDVSLEMLNLVEKQRFMNDDKRIAIISEAASSGISLHADRRAKNRCRRVHLTLELPWSADRAIQQFGRTHRSNQVSSPEYVFLISNLAGEKRFASIVAKRLESLGALTHGDRRATESRDLSQFNIDTKYGRQALELIMKYISKQDTKTMVEPPENYSGDFFEDCREGLAGVGMLTINRKTGAITLDKDFGNINKFLNRLLGLEVELQNSLFRYFNETMEAVVKQAKRTGKYDSGIIDLSSEVGNVQKLNQENFIMKSASGAIKIQLHTVAIDRGLPFERAENMYKQAIAEDDYFKNEIGFYVSNSTYQTRKAIFLAIPENPHKNKDVKQIFRIYKPSLGLQAKYETKSTLKERGTKLEDLKQAESLWREHYEKSETECTHMLLFGRCRMQNNYNQSLSSSSSIKTMRCDIGIRKRTYCVLSGAVLTVWPEIEKSIPYILNHKIQIVRLKTDDNLKYIGPMIPPMFVDEVRKCLDRLANGPPSNPPK